MASCSRTTAAGTLSCISRRLKRAGLNGLREGQKVQYELVPGRDGKSSAENLVALD